MINADDEVYIYNQHFVAMMNIINAARLNPPCKGHKHHIIPRCWFKMNNLPVDNSKDNIVLLTYEDHCKVHKLLTICVKDSKFRGKMCYAYHRLLTLHNNTDNVDWTLTKWIGSSNYGKKFTEEHKKKLSDSHKGRIFTEEHRKNISRAMTGKKAWNANMSGNYKEHLNMDEISKSYYEYKLTSLFPISWNCYQSYYHKGEI